MKIAVIKDPHFKFGFKNQNRVNYERDIIKKLIQLDDILTKEKCNTICIPGDVFDESYSRNWTLSKFSKNIEIIEQYLGEYEILTIPGNHDFFDGIENIVKEVKLDTGEVIHIDTAYSLANKYNIIKDISYKEVIKNVNNNEILITGIPYQHNISLIHYSLEKFCNLDYPLKIVMLHQNVTPGKIRHITEFSYEELSKYDIDIFLLGHYHVGFEPTVVNNTLFINPFNFTRTARTYEVKLEKHIPEVVIIDLSKALENLSECYKVYKLEPTPYNEAFIQEYQKLEELLLENSIDINFDIDNKEGIKTDEEILKELTQDKEIQHLVFKYLEGESLYA